MNCWPFLIARGTTGSQQKWNAGYAGFPTWHHTVPPRLWVMTFRDCFPKICRKREKKPNEFPSTLKIFTQLIRLGQSVTPQEGNGRFRVLKGLSTEQKSGLQTESNARMVPVKYLTQYIEAKFDSFFSMTVTEHWHSFPRGVVESPSLKILKKPSGCDPRQPA